jgi:hypothetical protein
VTVGRFVPLLRPITVLEADALSEQDDHADS